VSSSANKGKNRENVTEWNVGVEEQGEKGKSDTRGGQLSYRGYSFIVLYL